jgi:hypothetical protein
MPRGPEAAEIINQIEVIANTSGIALTTLDLEEENVSSRTSGQTGQNTESAGQHKTLGLKISLKGQYASLFRFLQNLERNQRIIDVEVVSFQGNEGSFNMEAKTYYLGE